MAAPSRRHVYANVLQSCRSPPCVIPASMEEHHGASSTALAAISEDTRCRSAARSFPAHPRKASLLRSEEHTSELQSLMRISYAVFCLKKKKTHLIQHKQLHLNTKHTQRSRSTRPNTKRHT